MRPIRAFLHVHGWLAAILIGFVLAVKVLVPAGFMPAGQSKLITVHICADAQGQDFTKEIAIPLADKAGDGQSKPDSASGMCTFGSLTMASLAGANAVLLTRALLFILAFAFAPGRSPPLQRLYRDLPPPRGPPASARSTVRYSI